MKQLGLIGAGNMGGAILRGALSDGYLSPSQVTVCDKSRRRMSEFSQEVPGIAFCDVAEDLAEKCDVILLAVKPNVLASVVEEIRHSLSGKAVISIAAGWPMKRLTDLLEGCGCTILRVMPNTPAMVGEGMTAICEETTFGHEDFEFAKGLFEAVGRTVVLPERLFDGVTALSGSSPAYIYMLIEAMADAGVREGIPRVTAYEMAAQSVLGSALMVLQSGDHPGRLKDAVCSPGGTTIDAVAELERTGFRSSVISAMRVCADKSRAMARPKDGQ